MAQDKDGGPAFPRAMGEVNHGQGEGEYNGAQKGMTLRQWYAGMALQGMLAYGSGVCGNDAVVKAAFDYADAMLSASSEKPR